VEVNIMTNPFVHLLPVYPMIAKQILDDYKITDGKCLDIGTGYGYLGLELAKITNLEMYFVDINPEVLDKAEKNVAECRLDNIVHFLEADVCSLPFEDNFADLIISRGSLWFWKDQIKGMQEINRVLKKGGVAFVGGGLGRYTPDSMRKRLQGMGRMAQIKKGEKGFMNGKKLQEFVDKTGITNCQLIADVKGQPATWIEIRK
jgi:ubiquinone/menaquinone biosynthesis C-methylase UbiE